MNAYSCTEIGISRSKQFLCIYVQENNIMVCQSLSKWRTVRFAFMLECQAKIFPLLRGLMSSRTDIKVQHEQTKNEWNLFKLNSLFCKQRVFWFIWVSPNDSIDTGFQIFSFLLYYENSYQEQIEKTRGPVAVFDLHEIFEKSLSFQVIQLYNAET